MEQTVNETNSLKEQNVRRSFHEVYLIWQWRAFLAEIGKEKEGTFGSVR